MFRRHQSQPIGRVIAEINPILRGWVQYFRIGHAGQGFTFVKEWVEKKMRRHMMRARKRSGFGWKRWSRDWLYTTLGLFKDYSACLQTRGMAWGYARVSLLDTRLPVNDHQPASPSGSERGKSCAASG